MDMKDPLLSHQYEAVLALANHFERIIVITGKTGEISKHPKIEILSTDWTPGEKFRNMAQLFKIAIPVIVRGQFHSVFFHMTDLQCALLSPIVRLRQRRQFLWYAHSHKSSYLAWSLKWITSVITSTPGSCPITGQRVIAIGQAIDEKRFSPIPFNELNLNKLIHIGRFDKSKNIDLLISESEKLHELFPLIELKIVGKPSNSESQYWATKLITTNKEKSDMSWLTFEDSINRNQFPTIMAENGCFFHAYMGSLDKTLIESTMLRVPVVSLNPEYLSIFGSWSKKKEVNLFDEYVALRGKSNKEIEIELNRRLSIAQQNHSLGNWVKQLKFILN